MKFLYLIIFTVFIIAGCQTIGKSLYGIKVQKKVDREKIEEFYKELNINADNFLQIDSSYVSWVKKEYQNDSGYLKFYLQPLQAFYFNSNGDVVSYHVNCNAGGFPKLNWTRNNNFATYPPVTQTKVDSNLKKTQIADLLRFEPQKNKDIVIVFWNLFLEKQSKLLLHLVNENIGEKRKNVQLVFVNNDLLFLEK